MTTEERIEADAMIYNSGFQDLNSIQTYIAGAKSERNKVLDEVVSFMDNTEKLAHWWDDEPELKGHIEGAESAFRLLRKHTNSLKV